ncbi:DUF58 domain-containing protein [Thermogemmatispora sp.]|uniref:DUF58 domain-containing protein n=1 Tax=Thermogemmatispora sp. TaxID=1968838 RepID=UPI002ACC1D3A|nr:DUF58 domain-containing protein [Thermogemmatispora sp.]
MKRSWYFFALIPLVVSIVFHQLLLMVIGLLFLLILLLVDIWATFCLTNLRYKRAFSQQRACFGEEIVLTQVVENAKLLPLPWLEVSDRVPLALIFHGLRPHLVSDGRRAIIESLFSPRWYERITRSYRIRCLARGVHTFGPAVLRSGDLFGFVSRRQELDNREQILVYPPIVPLSQLGLPARHPFGERRAPWRLLEDPARISGIRDYRQGDELRRIHWKATARVMSLQSKIYETSTTYTLVLFLNISLHLSPLDLAINQDLKELAICVTASVADWGLREGYAVGLYCNGMLADLEHSRELAQQIEDQQWKRTEALSKVIRLPPASGPKQRQHILETLARVEPYYGDPIEVIMSAESTRLPFGATVILVTSTLNEALLTVLERLRHSGHPVGLLSIGQVPMVKVPGMLVQHIGGEETWRTILALYERGQSRPGSP